MLWQGAYVNFILPMFYGRISRATICWRHWRIMLSASDVSAITSHPATPTDKQAGAWQRNQAKFEGLLQRVRSALIFAFRHRTGDFRRLVFYFIVAIAGFDGARMEQCSAAHRAMGWRLAWYWC